MKNHRKLEIRELYFLRKLFFTINDGAYTQHTFYKYMYIYIYIYTWNLFVLYFWPWTLQKKALSTQNKGHLGSRYIFVCLSIAWFCRSPRTEPHPRCDQRGSAPATKKDGGLTQHHPKWWLSKTRTFLILGKSSLVKYYNLARLMKSCFIWGVQILIDLRCRIFLPSTAVQIALQEPPKKSLGNRMTYVYIYIHILYIYLLTLCYVRQTSAHTWVQKYVEGIKFRIGSWQMTLLFGSCVFHIIIIVVISVGCAKWTGLVRTNGFPACGPQTWWMYGIFCYK